MYRHKAVYLTLAVLMLFIQIGPVLAVPEPVQETTPQTSNPAIETSNQISSDTTVTAELERALAEAEIVVRQTQAERITQELDLLGDELESLNTDFFAESAKLAAIETSLNEANERLRWYEAELEAQRKILNERIVEIYRHGNVEPIDALVNKASFKDMLTRLSFLLRISEQDAELLRGIEEQHAKVDETRSSLDSLFAQQKEITVQLEARKTAIEVKIEEEAKILASIDVQTRQIIESNEAERQREQVDVVNKLVSKRATDKMSLEPGTVAYEALQYLGVPYVWGGKDPATGLDCSGLVQVVYAKFGVNLAYYSRAQAKLGVGVGYDDLQSGDLVFFGRPIHHVGIYLGEGYYIHAPKRNDFVKVSKMSDRRDHAGARRILSSIPVAGETP